jgi:hypothetical protein
MSPATSFRVGMLIGIDPRFVVDGGHNTKRLRAVMPAA